VAGVQACMVAKADVMTSKLDTKELDKLISGIENDAANVVARTAMQVTALAKIHALRDSNRLPKNTRAKITGFLRAGIGPEMINRFLWHVNSDAEYSVFHEPVEGLTEYRVYELGGHRIPARPFLSPSVEKVRAQFNQMIAEIFK